MNISLTQQGENLIKVKINCKITRKSKSTYFLTSVSKIVKIAKSGFFLTSVSKETRGGIFSDMHIYLYINLACLFVCIQ